MSAREWLQAKKAWREAAEAQARAWSVEDARGPWDAVTSRVFQNRLDKLEAFLRAYFRGEHDKNPALFDPYDAAALVILPRRNGGLKLARRLFKGGPGIAGDLGEGDLTWSMDWFRPRSFH